jgi:hypothetical protein
LFLGGNTITAVDIMQILLSDENKGTASSSSTTDSGISMSPSTTSAKGTDNTTTVENLNLDDYKLDGKNQTIISFFFFIFKISFLLL